MQLKSRAKKDARGAERRDMVQTYSSARGISNVKAQECYGGEDLAPTTADVD